MKRQTAEKKVREFLEIANSTGGEVWVDIIHLRRKDVRVELMAKRPLPDRYDGKSVAAHITISLLSLIEKRYPARKKAKATRRTK